MIRLLLFVIVSGFCSGVAVAGEVKPQVSGIYPHLAMCNKEGECGTGAVVPWADRLWVITYGPHLPFGSSDKLYEITPGLNQIIRPESIGGTPANRMIHRESQQLIIGPYFIETNRNVRVVSWKDMPGRLTGSARHLADPAGKIYFATMEEGLYEVDVKTLEVTGLIKDGNKVDPARVSEKHPATTISQLPGYHGKGLYSGQGRVIYANNGEHGSQALTDPAVPSGALAEWRGSGDWQLVRRNQFTEVTGPGGIPGNGDPDGDPIWSIGWDYRSLILMVLDGGKWHAYRLPKASHCYDGAHGWNTEWPRIRDIGEDSLLMTMHGMFWKFPKEFSSASSAGIVPRSTYLKVVGDFCKWSDRLVLGCDDTAKSEFLNKRKAKGDLAATGRSQSNLWFVEPSKLDSLGPVIAGGAVWLADPVKAGVPSDPFLFSGFDHRGLHITHDNDKPAKFELEVDVKGDGSWKTLRVVEVPAHGYVWTEFTADEQGAWVRVKTDRDCKKTTGMFRYSNRDPRGIAPASIFDGLAGPAAKSITGGLLHAGGEEWTLSYGASDEKSEVGAYELDGDLKLRPAKNPSIGNWLKKNVAVPKGILTVDKASVLYSDGKGRWRLPKGDNAFDGAGPIGDERVCREVCTERDLFNAHGTFYELPAENAGGFARIRPIATHNRRIKDYASYRGLLVMSGVVPDAAAGGHIIKSDDGKCALWVGAVDDLWQLGKPRGNGGPLKDTPVTAGKPSDAYLMNGYDRKSVQLSHDSNEEVRFFLEVDFGGNIWSRYKTFKVAAGQKVSYEFPDAFQACWVRVECDRDCRATAQFEYK